jgi:hypothetical protein
MEEGTHTVRRMLLKERLYTWLLFTAAMTVAHAVKKRRMCQQWKSAVTRRTPRGPGVQCTMAPQS